MTRRRALRRLPAALFGALLAAVVVSTACAEATLERLGLATVQPLSISFVVHGEPDDPVWQEIRAGAESAGQAFHSSISWQSSADTDERVRMVEDSISQGFDVIVVTLSDPLGMERVVRQASVEGVIVYVINAGVQYALGFGADAFFGMSEIVAGLAAGERLAVAGATNLLCVQPEEDNQGLITRCEQAEFRVGETVQIVVDPRLSANIEARVAEALAEHPSIDAVITSDGWRLAGPARAAIDRVRANGRAVLHVAFGIDEPVLRSIDEGAILFAVDQQPWLQGYLPVAYAQVKRFSARTRGDEVARVLLQWAEGGGILLGPGFVDQRNVQLVRASGAVADGPWWVDEP